MRISQKNRLPLHRHEKLMHPPRALVPTMPGPLIPLTLHALPLPLIDVLLAHEVEEGRCEDGCDFASVQFGEDVARGVRIAVCCGGGRRAEVGDAGTHPELGHGEVGGEFGEVLHCIAGWEGGVCCGEADFFVGFAAGDLEGRFVEGVGFPAWEGGLAGIWEGESGCGGGWRCWGYGTVLETRTTDRQDDSQVTLAVGEEENEDCCAPRKRAFVPVGCWAGEGAEVCYRPLWSIRISLRLESLDAREIRTFDAGDRLAMLAPF